LDRLQRVPDAAYDGAPGCLGGTREEVIGKIIGWIDGHGDQPICWVNGSAGSGKSAIARTVASMCEEGGLLGASFFFLRGAGGRSSITHFISTLAYRLAYAVPATSPYIEDVLRKDRDIHQRSLQYQLRKLIIEPIRSVAGLVRPTVIIVDALDECDNGEEISKFIEILISAAQDRALPLRFFFTSRVEEHIRKKFAPYAACAVTYCLALRDFDADDDLRRYFRACFNTIYQEKRRLMGNIIPPWPSQSDLDKLVELSDGSFIFAFTIINFVNDGRGLPHRKLQTSLRSHNGLDSLIHKFFKLLVFKPLDPVLSCVESLKPL
jgi:hypothetical protein